MKKQILSVLTLSLLVTISSCQPNAEFFDKTLSIEGDLPNPDTKLIEEPAPNPKPEPEIVVEEPEVILDPKGVEIECAKAIQAGALKEKVYNIKFDAVLDCPWGENGNISLSAAQNCVLGARAEIEKKIILPNNAKRFCDLDIKFVNDKQSYDDEVIVTLQNYVLLSSQDFSSPKIDDVDSRLVKDNDGLVKYDWSRIFNSLYYKKNACINSNKAIEHYCLGYEPGTPEYIANCKLPPTEQVGQMSILIPNSSIYKLSSKIGLEFDQKVLNGDPKVLSLKIITIGDNDPKDCRQAGADVVVSLKYITE